MGRDAQTPDSVSPKTVKNRGGDVSSKSRGHLIVAALATPVGLVVFGAVGLVSGWTFALPALAAGLLMSALVIIVLRRTAAGSSTLRDGPEEPRYRELFEQSPVAIWENDWSDVKREVDRLVASGIDDVESYLLENKDVARRLIDKTRIVSVNYAAIAMYGLTDSDQMTKDHALGISEDELTVFCERVGVFIHDAGPITIETTDRSVDGAEIRVRMTSDVPEAARDTWGCVVHIVEDVTEQWRAQDELAQSEQRYRELFDQCPVSIWVEDWSAVKPLVDKLRELIGDDELGAYIDAHPEFVAKAYDVMELIDINDTGWRLMGAKNKEELLDWAGGPIQDADVYQTAQILKGIVEGRSRVSVDETQDFTLDNRNIFIRGTSYLPPAYADDWSRVIHVFEDTTAHHVAAQRVRESGQLLEMAQHMTGHGHFVYDADLDEIVTCSDELAHIFGIDPEDFLVGQRQSFAFVHADDRDRVAAALKTSADLHNPVDIEYRVKRPDGTVRHVHEVSDFLIGENSEQTGRRIGTIDDITEQRETEEALRWARDEAERANRSKSEFLANVSHELRTPLNAIIGFSDVLLDGTFGDIDSARSREYIGDINESGRHLLELINDILDLSKAEAGRLELTEEDIVVDRLIRQSVRLVRERAERSGIDIGIDLPGGLPMVHVDARKLRQVLLNLLSNAVKFTPADGDVTVLAQLQATGELDIIVADTGIGIQEDDIDRAFEVFGQVDSALARRFEGTGLGLPLARAIIELHDGELLIESKPHGGTRVTVRLPGHRVMQGQARQAI